jgi:hypothetical protein
MAAAVREASHLARKLDKRRDERRRRRHARAVGIPDRRRTQPVALHQRLVQAGRDGWEAIGFTFAAEARLIVILKRNVT